MGADFTPFLPDNLQTAYVTKIFYATKYSSSQYLHNITWTGALASAISSENADWCSYTYLILLMHHYLVRIKYSSDHWYWLILYLLIY